MIDTRIKSVFKLHNVLHGFFAGRGMGTASMELKLAQELENVDQFTIFLVLIYLREYYNNLD